jgi:glyoxylase-like metal-dependent hydrolase (beta-lactamase superfamily II)
VKLLVLDTIGIRIASTVIATCFLAAISSLVSRPGFAHEIDLPLNLDKLSLHQTTLGIYVAHGVQGMPDSSNAGFMSNSGIVLTGNGVVVIDSGGSWRVGKRLVEEIGRLTTAPVIAVFNTHIHGDHWLGNSAIAASYPGAKFYAHSRAIQRLQAGEAGEWSAIISGLIGGDPDPRPPLVPVHALEGGEVLELGGTEFSIHHTGHAHTDHDILVEVPSARILFAGDVIEHGRLVSSDVPRDFNALGQIAAIRYALELPVDVYVPGHGPSGDRRIARESLDFLEELHAGVKCSSR